jgi:hypothetical protein
MIQREICGNSLEPVDRVLFSVGLFKEGFPTARSPNFLNAPKVGREKTDASNPNNDQNDS